MDSSKEKVFVLKFVGKICSPNWVVYSSLVKKNTKLNCKMEFLFLSNAIYDLAEA